MVNIFNTINISVIYFSHSYNKFGRGNYKFVEFVCRRVLRENLFMVNRIVGYTVIRLFYGQSNFFDIVSANLIRV